MLTHFCIIAKRQSFSSLHDLSRNEFIEMLTFLRNRDAVALSRFRIALQIHTEIKYAHDVIQKRVTTQCICIPSQFFEARTFAVF